ncbi:LTA synthase family protein [Brevibacillus laterosporus]|uniref:LTA synthase family protein n=1 Tax=Brevibacillus laterosporus TaxID=1465 RepID=UPI001EF1CBC9|nr:LTA synthase family protein [Brevibacillus laterosporus]MCG7317272.1 LTA synthase family protein [Brevibacillus laterosporus]
MNWKKYSLITSLLLLSKFFWFRIFIYDDRNPFRLLWAETSSVLLIVVIFTLLFYKRKTLMYTIANFLLSSFMLAIVVYFSYYGKIMTYQAFMQIGQVKDVSSSVFSLIKPQYFVLYLDLVIFLLWYRSMKKKKQEIAQAQLDMTLVKRLLLAACCVVVLFSLEGVKAERTAGIQNETKKAQQQGLITFQVNSFLKDQKVPVWNEEYTARIKQLKAEREKQQPKQLFGAAKGKNVMVIQMEAFQNFVLNKKINGVEITPNLNALIKESYYFPHFFQQVGQGNTSDAEFISNTSIYPVGTSPMSVSFGEREIPSLPRMLKELGYTSMTFHVNKADFWNRDVMYPGLGFDKYYDTEFFGYEDIVGLGPSDEILFDKTLGVLEEQQKQNRPFYSQIITLSGHHPFVIPQEKITLSLPPAWEGTNVGNYIQAQHYVDKQLGALFAKMKQNGLWDNTVIALYGDHYGITQDEQDKDGKPIIESLTGHVYDKVDAFTVPLIVKVPGNITGKTMDNMGGQIDIMPTIANLVGLDLSNTTYFGQDLLNTTHNVLGERFYMPSGSFINDDILFIPGQSLEDGSATNIKTHEAVVDLEPYRKMYDEILELLSISDAYVNQLPMRD